MDKNKLIIEHCPNFYKIVNFDFFEDDNFTACLIKIYREYIFSVNILDNNELNRVVQIDKILAKYIDDYVFRKTMKYELSQIKFENRENILQKLVNSILGIFDKYEEGKTRNIYIARWI
ncbi:MAG: hypothetical protein IJ572_03340 [Bacilli bacterium]|nr:hypothetical protein [Bacilli bacterium]